jgi:thiol-disulfide isomerase/thioredoxin
MLTPSIMLPLGTRAADFSLLDTVSGTVKTLKVLASQKATVIMFICNHCPYVIHILDRLLLVASEYQKKGVSFIAISSNDVSSYPQDGPDKMALLAAEYHFCFPYLYDETQVVAKAYQAACTPDFYVFDHNVQCVYRGCFDASNPGNQIEVTGEALMAAMDAVLVGGQPVMDQQPSVGCNIKWIS